MFQQNEVVSETPSPNQHIDAAQQYVQALRQMRQTIPHFSFPTSPRETQRLLSAARVPAEFVELTSVATANHQSLVRDGADAARIRDLLSYADAYGPLAEELEALARFVRHSIAAARNKAGSEALTTYALAQRLAKRPETADLVPQVAAMRRALGRGRRGKRNAAPPPASPAE